MNGVRLDNDVVLFSRDQTLIDSLHNSMGDNDPNLIVEGKSPRPANIPDCQLVIYDMELVNNNASRAVKDVLLIKDANPNRALILLGKKSALGQVLTSDEVSSYVSRSYPKPVLTSKLMMAIEVFSPQKNTSDSSHNRFKSTMIVAGVTGLGLLAIIGLYLGGDEPSTVVAENTVVALPKPVAPVIQQSDLAGIEVQKLNQLAQTALTEGRIISPDGDNALHYYEQALQLDEYNTEAYQGRQTVLQVLHDDFPKRLQTEQFAEAKTMLAVLERLEPFSEEVESMRNALVEAEGAEKLEQSVQIAEAESADIPPSAPSSVAEAQNETEGDAVESLKRQRLVEVDQAIRAGRLIPPQAGSAYALLRDGLQNKLFSNQEIAPLKNQLVNDLIVQAKQSLEQEQLEEAKRQVAYIRRLERNHSELAALTATIQQQQATQARAEETVSVAAPKQPPATVEGSITPPQLVKRVEPIYPKRAYNFDVEGWVELEYQVDQGGKPINIRVIEAQPKRLFDKAAMDALKQWQFEPAKDTSTAALVVSEPSTTRFNFELSD